ncbi:hypothetical protein M1O17_02385, partial [Dehalococcoidia bacterium]|nr:hypothetical protein [Dehalococcoidia bacterium]
TRLVEVRAEKRYTTKPRLMSTLVFPNLTLGNVHVGHKHNALIVVECNLQVREAIVGFKERRGPNELIVDYPLNPSSGCYFDQSRFTRNYFTTGIILTHPILNSLNVRSNVIANLLFEAFLMVVPFERRDISFASDRHRVGSGPITEGDRFVSIYDQTYGSLRLSGRLSEEHVLKPVLEKCVELARYLGSPDINCETMEAIEKIQSSSLEPAVQVHLKSETSTSIDADRFVKVIMPGSKGLNVNKNNEEFAVAAVFFSPEIGGLAYRGKQIPEKTSPAYEGLTTIISIASITEVPGESRLGLYCYQTGEIEEVK